MFLVDVRFPIRAACRDHAEAPQVRSITGNWSVGADSRGSASTARSARVPVLVMDDVRLARSSCPSP